MQRVYNFSSGPAAVDESVLTQLQNEMLDCRGSGMSILEMNHKSTLFGDILQQTDILLRRLLSIPDTYEILYVNGGGSMQFCMIPVNLMRKYKKAFFIDTDLWTHEAIKEAEKIGTAQIIASSEDRQYRYIPTVTGNDIPDNGDYLYICTNNTATGTAYRPYKIPKQSPVPLVADMTSNFLSEEYAITDFGLVFAAAQKNLGPSGVSIVIIRKDLIYPDNSNKIPKILDYSAYQQSHSTFSTPATFAIYMIMLVLQWIEKRGGAKELALYNKRKATLLYDYIDNSALFHNDINKEDRSLMNVVFTTGIPDVDRQFCLQAEKNGLVNLMGYQGTNVLRAGIYNAVTYEAVEHLVEFMKNFERNR